VLSAPFGGETGSVLRHLLEQEGIGVGGVDVRGANGFYVHDRRSGHRDRVASRAGEQLDRHEADDLYNNALVAGLDADSWCWRVSSRQAWCRWTCTAV
jgi:1-phosphofructokinase